MSAGRRRLQFTNWSATCAARIALRFEAIPTNEATSSRCGRPRFPRTMRHRLGGREGGECTSVERAIANGLLTIHRQGTGGSLTGPATVLLHYHRQYQQAHAKRSQHPNGPPGQNLRVNLAVHSFRLADDRSGTGTKPPVSASFPNGPLLNLRVASHGEN